MAATAGAAELLERIARDDRVDDRAVGQALAGLVMVGDDDLDPCGQARVDLLGRADPAVDGDQQAGARARSSFASEPALSP